MKSKAQSLAAAAGSLFLLGATAQGHDDKAQEKPAAKPAMEKCYGVVRTAKNDCHTATHSCAGQAKTDGDSQEWLLVPKGTCERLVGGNRKPDNK